MVSPGIVDAVLQGLVTGSIIAAGALGLSLIYSIGEVPNFAHGDMITVGAYVALAINVPGEVPFVPDFGGLSLIVSGVLALGIAGVLGGVYETTIFKKFRRNDADLITMVIVSLGLALMLRNLVLFLVGSKNVGYDTARVVNTNVDVYVSAAGIGVQTTQRQAGELALLGEWGYSWLVVLAGLALTVGAGVAVYRQRQSRTDYKTVHLVSPRVLGVLTGLGVAALVAAVARGGFTGTDAAWATRVGLSLKYGLILALVAVTMFLMNLLLKRTKTGKAMRATADNMSLAEVRGVEIDRVQLVVWALAGVLTALAGVLTGWFASNLNPNMGFVLLLPVFAAVILGGITSPYGAVLGSLVIGLSMEVGVYLMPAEYAAYRTAIAFVILILVLLVKPEGLWGDV